MWLEWIFALSLTLLVQLVVLAVELNDRDALEPPAAPLTDWNVTFVVLYVFLALLGAWAIVRALFALLLCARGRPTAAAARAKADDNDVDDLLAPAEDFGAPAPSEARGARAEAGVRFGDALVDLVFAGLDLAIVAVLAHILMERDAGVALVSWTPLFALLFTRLALLELAVLVGAVQTFALERALAGGSRAGAVCGGVLCCCPATERVQDEALRELDYRDERNTTSGVAREARYRRRAQFQDWDCVYVCAPRALPNFVVYLRAALFFLIVPTLILSAALLLARLRALDAAADTLVAPAGASVDDDTVPARFRHHDGASHYLPAFAAAGGNWTDLAAHHPSLRWNGDAPSVGVVLAPLFALGGALLLQSTCMCVAYAAGARQRAATEWTLGALYVVALLALIVSGALLADRIDTLSDIDWHAVFAPLYVAFALNVLVAGSVLLCCTPDPYRLAEERRAIVSRWGLCVYKRE